MPKEVVPPHDFMTRPAANLEDMTQPMGPLEEGDQALVDAAHMLPEGEHRLEGADGTHTRVSKYEEPGREQVIAETRLPDGTIEQASTLIDSTPGVDGISADISEWPAGERGGHTVVEARDNQVGSVLNPQTDRKQAQAIKMETAREIDAARGRLEEGRIQDLALAREMADAEKPHRDEIAERNQEAAAAGEAAEEAARRYYEDRSLAGELAAKTKQAGELGSTAVRANERSLNHADAAAAEARERHEAEQ